MSRKFLTPIALPSGTQNPTVGSIGELFYRSDLDSLYVHTGVSWVAVGGSDTAAIDGGIVGEDSFLIGGASNTTIFSRTADGGAPDTSSFQTTYSGGTA